MLGIIELLYAVTVVTIVILIIIFLYWGIILRRTKTLASELQQAVDKRRRKVDRQGMK